MDTISFNTKEYDPFLDFLKGLCIICVVLTHAMDSKMQQWCMFPYWGAFAVPIFFTISCFHYFRHSQGSYYNQITKVFKRVLKPFLFVQSIIIGSIIISYLLGSGKLTTPLVQFLKHGGEGPGTFFVWAYIQFSLIILPFTVWMINRFLIFKNNLLLLVLVCSIILEFVSSYFGVPLYIHRLTAFPYIYLIFYGYKLSIGGIEVKRWTPIIVIISIILIALMNYTDVDFSPWVYMKTANNFHWFCYPFAIYVVVVIAKSLYKSIGGGIRNVISSLGLHSYEIFVWQMLVFYFLPYNIMNKWVYLVTSILLSIIPVWTYFKIKERWLISVKQ